MAKAQLHKRFKDEQVRDIVGKYVKKQIRAKEACRYLGMTLGLDTQPIEI